MILRDQVALITGGASGLGLAAARQLVDAGAHVVIADLPTSAGEERAAEFGASSATFVAADVTDADQVDFAVRTATARGVLRAVVHTAGRGGPVRLVDKDGKPGDAAKFDEVIRVNLSGSFLVASIAAAAMVDNELSDGDRGAIVLTASVAAFEGQVGQAAYAASKGGIVALTLQAARDLAARQIRVCTIAPGLMDTPLLSGVREDIRQALGESVPHPRRLGRPEEFGSLARQILENGYLNGETLRLDGAIRMAPR